MSKAREACIIQAAELLFSQLWQEHDEAASWDWVFFGVVGGGSRIDPVTLRSACMDVKHYAKSPSRRGPCMRKRCLDGEQMLSGPLQTATGKVSVWYGLCRVSGHQLVEQLKQDQIKPFPDMSYLDQRALGDVYEKYQAALRQNNALDFDDLMSHAVAMLQTPAVSTWHKQPHAAVLWHYLPFSFLGGALVILLGLRDSLEWHRPQPRSML